MPLSLVIATNSPLPIWEGGCLNINIALPTICLKNPQIKRLIVEKPPSAHTVAFAHVAGIPFADVVLLIDVVAVFALPFCGIHGCVRTLIQFIKVMDFIVDKGHTDAY